MITIQIHHTRGNVSRPVKKKAFLDVRTEVRLRRPRYGNRALIQTRVARLFDDRHEGEFPKLIAICALLIGGNVLVWMWALAQFAGRPALLGTALLAYIFW